MPGYVIHLAVAKEYLKINKIENESEFYKGVIIVDMLKTLDSHYGIKQNKLDIDLFKSCIDFNTSYGKGYYLHMITDYIFYFKFLSIVSTELYNDYDILNEFLINKYNVIIPSELVDIVKFKIGTPTLINESSICEFIDMVSKIDLDEYFKSGDKLN